MSGLFITAARVSARPSFCNHRVAVDLDEINVEVAECYRGDVPARRRVRQRLEADGVNSVFRVLSWTLATGERLTPQALSERLEQLYGRDPM